MSTQDEIFKWVQEFEPWKQELFRRSSVSPDLSAEDVQRIADLLLGQGAPAPEPREVTRDELPDAEQQGEPMTVCSLSGLRNVNAIDDDQKIEFGPGLNVVYGRNGAGKTGYSRILKHAGRTLHRESVLPNVRDETAGGPSAVVTVKIGDQEEEAIPLDLEALGPAKLGRICIADADACDVYLTSDTEVDYVPVSLASIRRFTAGLKALDEELDRRRQDAIPTEIDTQIYGDSEVAKLLTQMSAKTPEASILTLAELSEVDLAKKAELTKQRGAIQASETPKLRLAAERDATSVQALLDDLGGLSRFLTSEQLNARRGEIENLDALQKASTEAAKQFENPPLQGIGSDPWRTLWEAARLYAEHISQGFPVGHDPARCPLCMQELGRDARQRLIDFEEFVKNNVNAKLANAESTLRETLDSLPDVDALSGRRSHAIELLGEGEGEPGAQVVAWLVGAKVIVEAIRNKALDGVQGISSPPEALSRWIKGRRAEAEKYAGLENVDDQKAVMNELTEIEARHLLGERRQEIVDHLGGLREVAAIEAAKGRLGRTAASRKLTELSRALIEANIQEALNRQLKALDFSGLEVSAKSKSPGGKPKLGLKFKTVDKVPLTAVLSKGEQRRLSLAMFLAELEVMSDPSPMVLDDPVSSIDQEGRRHIARTLLALAGQRQVIIFTHELSFIYELDRLAPADLPVTVQQLRRRGKTVGHVFPDVPWQGLKAKQRVAPLHEKLVDARGLHAVADEAKYEAAATEYCVLLREAFERAVEEGVLVDVVTRRKDTVHVLSLRKIRWNEEICELVERGTDENSPWVHDQPRGDGAIPPTPDELSAGLDVFKELLAAIKAFKPGGKGLSPLPPMLKAVDEDGSVSDHPAPTPLRIVDNLPARGKDSPAS
jgi:hypothetical protein